MEDASSTAFHIKTQGVDASATQGALSSLERMWTASLAWAEHNPLLFVACLLLVGWAMWLNHLTAVKNAGQRIDFEERREQIRLSMRQPELRLTGGGQNDGSEAT